ncbi:MAG: cytochrome family subfamily [Actinomycetota bacterium]|nr:cytochrome family subfamily [Actinomycetota bacterium]
MTDFAASDFFRGRDLIADPYDYFDWLRSQCPVQREPHHDVMMVTGYDEAAAIYANTSAFSSCNSPTGPFPGFPLALHGDDVSDLIEQHRDELPFSDQILTFDPPVHTAHRALLMRLITPKRLKENEEFMWRLADRQLDEFLDRGDDEFISGYGQPFALLVIADLLGVPEADHELFREQLGPRQHERSGTLGGTGDDDALAHSPLGFLYAQFSDYVEARRREPQDDVLTGLATATFPDGSEPDVLDVARIAANLFAAGQETSVRLFGAALQRLAEDHDLQEQLRAQRELIPNFVEECLRFESPVKGDFRLARMTTTVGDTEIPAGTTVMVVNGAANRDPRKFECPAEFQAQRANARQHLAFGHGPHSCPGAPLARAEGRITVERFLDRMSDIRISGAQHGPPGARRYEFVPTYILRGLTRLHLEWTTNTPS